jgi:LuxR family maltose regulon positive regulatory protein
LPGLIASLINDLTALGTPLTLVLDDYHHITSPDLHGGVQFLLERQPPSMHLVIGTRRDPPLPLALWRARSQVTEIREPDLRFTVDQVAAFLTHTMGLIVSAETISALQAHTEGWIAGLQLVALALRQERHVPRERHAADAFLATLIGGDRYVKDYLMVEVLNRQPAAMRDFLQQTAVLDRLTAPLCDAVRFGERMPAGKADSQAMLEQLQASNVFMTPLDNRGEWYRYHPLFAEFLRARLHEQDREQLYRRAARWHESHGLIAQAIDYAKQSGNLDDIERLIRLAAESTIHRGGVVTVRNWLDALPEDRVRADGELSTYKGWALSLTGSIASAQTYANIAQVHLDAEPLQELPAYRGTLLSLQSWIAVFGQQDYANAIELAVSALNALEPEQAYWQVTTLWTMAEAQERTCHIGEAIDTFRRARQIGLALDAQLFVATTEMSLALSLNNHGQRRQAMAICEQAIERYTDEQGRLLPIAGLILSRLGMLTYEANQLDQAEACYEQSLILCKQLPLETDTLLGGLAAPVLHAQGKSSKALAALHTAHQISTQTSLWEPEWFLTCEANIRLSQGDIAFVHRWAEAQSLSPDTDPQYMRIEQHLVYARLLIVQGRLPDARRLLARLERFTRDRGLYRWSIVVHILQALTAMRLGDATLAGECLARAVREAAPEGYTRAFLDEDPSILSLLPGVHDVAPAFVGRLLAEANLAQPDRALAAQPLIEPLSERELEVLGLIAAGLQNKEIASELTITLGTVKRHINNIYGKLGVHHRIKAIAKARELGLVE